MATFMRRTTPEAFAQAKAHNRLCGTAIVVGATFFHADIYSTYTGDWMAPVDTAVALSTTASVDIVTATALANAFRAILIGAGTTGNPGAQPGTQGHMFDAISTNTVACGSHKVPDTVNAATLQAVQSAPLVLTGVTGTDTAALVAFVNQLKASYNAHLTQAGVHFNNDGTNSIGTANATDLPSSITLINACAVKINAHIISAPGSVMLNVLPV